MNIVMWMLAGGVIGWLGYSVLGFNEARGMMVSIIIGAIGGIFGGKIIAPMLVAAATVPGAFSWSTMFIAVMIAAAFLAIGNMVHKKWGV